MRSKALRVAWANSAGGLDLTAEKRKNSELDAYRAARAQGIQPATTRRRDIEEAVRISDETGKAFQA